MNDQQAPPQQQQKQSKGDAIGALYLVCNVHATALTPLFRYGFGREALGVPGFLALLLIVVYASAAAPPMYLYLIVWLLAVIYRRIQTFRLLRQGAVIHSRSPGYPWLAMQFPFVRKERAAVLLVEPLSCILIGALLSYVSVAMGAFFAFGCVSLLLRQAIEDEIARQRLQRMRDNELEGRWMSDRFRNGQW